GDVDVRELGGAHHDERRIQVAPADLAIEHAGRRDVVALDRHFFSTAAFICASPFSNSGPIILSGPPTTRQTAFAIRLSLRPLMVQVTVVPEAAAAKSNIVSAVEANGRMNASLIRICFAGSLATMVMLPSPTSL